MEAAREAVATGAVTCWLQPVVSLGTGEVLGYEALARGPSGSPVHEPGVLFPAAERAGCAGELERLCRLRALEAKRDVLGEGQLIFVNVDPQVPHLLAGKGRAGRGAIDGLGVERHEVVVEVTERIPIHHPAVARELDRYRARGFPLALDDVGVGHSGLAAIVDLRPDYLKIDRFLVQGVERDPHRQALIRMLALYAQGLGIRLVAEGIDTPERLALLCRLEVPYGQGFFLGPPAPSPAGVLPEALAVIRSVAGRSTGLGDGPLPAPLR